MTTEPKTPATVKELQAAFPKAKAEFLLQAAAAEMTLADAKEAYYKALEADHQATAAERDALKAKVEAMTEEEKKKMMEEEKKEGEAKAAAAKKTGAMPVAHASGSSAGLTALEQWNGLIQAKVSAGMPKAKAVMAAGKENPALRKAMLDEYNGR